MSQTRRRRQARKRKRQGWNRGVERMCAGVLELTHACAAYARFDTVQAVACHFRVAELFSEGGRMMRRGKP